MSLNISKGNMYQFIDATWNTIKGKCPHDCSYCYMKRWGNLKHIRLDEKELKTDLGKGNFIFVGSSCDMWANDIPEEWIIRTLEHCHKFMDNFYLFQTKNPARVEEHIVYLPKNVVICTTIESNRWYDDIMNNSPKPKERAMWLNEVAHHNIKTYVTIEPIMDFDLDEMLYLIETCLPEQVNIGADSGNNRLPEPSEGKILSLIEGLQKFTIIHNKSNLKRLLKNQN